MDVATISMTPEQAQLKLDAWMEEKHVDQAEVKAWCVAGYKALAEGKVLVHLDAAIRGGGFHPGGYPKLAIAAADRREVRFTWSSTSNRAHYDTTANWTRQPGRLVRTIDMQRVPNIFEKLADGRSWAKSLDGYAQVPLLPAECRPATGQLRDWFILWEVERWYASSNQVQPDRDPMLLEHVAGQLYAVLAEWDLTELERAVMAGALRPEA